MPNTPTNQQAAVNVLEVHRTSGTWTPETVAADLLAQLSLDPGAPAKNAKPIHDPNAITEDEVVAHETAAQIATDKAKAARAELEAQKKAAADEAKAASAEDKQAAYAASRAQQPAVPRAKS
jgi:hypothetical protein